MVEFYEIYEEANKTDKPRLLKSKFSVRTTKFHGSFAYFEFSVYFTALIFLDFLNIILFSIFISQLFNSGMDALLSQQGEWRVSSSLLREILGTELLQKILPLYKDFFSKYSKIQFSKKHMGEYLRFPPEDVERLLKNFFGKA